MDLFQSITFINRLINSCFISSKSYNSFFLLLSAVILLQSCTDEPAAVTSPVLDKSVIMPLQVGNYWTYKEITYDDSGNEEIIETKTGVIVKTITVKDEIIYRLDFIKSLTDTLSPDNMPTYYINKENGLNIYFKNILNSEPVLFIKYPVSKDENYLFYQSGFKFNVPDLNFKYSVPLGTFDCIKYVLNLPTVWNKNDIQMCFYYSPGIGEIAFEEYEKITADSLRLNFKRVMISYKLK